VQYCARITHKCLVTPRIPQTSPKHTRRFTTHHLTSHNWFLWILVHGRAPGTKNPFAGCCQEDRATNRPPGVSQPICGLARPPSKPARPTVRAASQAFPRHARLSSNTSSANRAIETNCPLDATPPRALSLLKYDPPNSPWRWAPVELDSQITPLTEAPREKRLRYALDNRTRDWSLVFFCDETSFYARKHRVRRTVQEEFVPAPTLKRPPNINAWVGIATRSKGKLFLFKEGLDGAPHKRIITDNMMPSLRALNGRRRNRLCGTSGQRSQAQRQSVCGCQGSCSHHSPAPATPEPRWRMSGRS